MYVCASVIMHTQKTYFPVAHYWSTEDWLFAWLKTGWLLHVLLVACLLQCLLFWTGTLCVLVQRRSRRAWTVSSAWFLTTLSPLRSALIDISTLPSFSACLCLSLPACLSVSLPLSLPFLSFYPSLVRPYCYWFYSYLPIHCFTFLEHVWSDCSQERPSHAQPS